MRFLPRFRERRAAQSSFSYADVIEMVQRAYNQGYWDGCHSKDPRTSVQTRPEGLSRHLEKEAKRLRD
jgi:hypothetical protein